jgi:curli production assembly/transport component CsgG
VLCAVYYLSACTSVPASNVRSNAQLSPASQITRDLVNLPKPKEIIAVAVYAFRDQTGQFKPSPDSSYSTSVTQGAASILVKALKDSGWYNPVEREGLQNLLTERKIVRAIESLTEKGKPAINLPGLMPASLNIEGGVIAYESNVRTGGKGANYLGLGGNDSYRVDQVTVNLRMVDIRNGQVLDTVSVTKTIYSYQINSGLYAFVSYQRLLQLETGFTTNEPAQLAVREAIESAVIHLTALSVRDRVLALADDEDINSSIIQTYLKEAQDIVRDRPTTEEGPNIGFSVLAAVNGISMVRPLVQPEVTPHELKLSVQLSPPPLKAPSPSTTGNVENINSAVGTLLGYIN